MHTSNSTEHSPQSIKVCYFHNRVVGRSMHVFGYGLALGRFVTNVFSLILIATFKVIFIPSGWNSIEIPHESVGRCSVLPCPENTVVTAGGERGNAPSSARCRWQQETATAAVAMRQRSTHCCAAVNFRPTRSARASLSNGRQLRDPLGVGTPPQPCVRAAAVPPGPAAPGSLGPGRCALRLHAASRAGRAEPRARVPARVRGAARLRAAEPQRRRGPGGRRGAADGAAGSGGGGGGAPRSRRAAPGSGEAAARRGSLVAGGGGGGGAPDARGGQKMCHGKQASGGGALPAARRRALAAALWLRLALSLGPGPAAGGE